MPPQLQPEQNRPAECKMTQKEKSDEKIQIFDTEETAVSNKVESVISPRPLMMKLNSKLLAANNRTSMPSTLPTSPQGSTRASLKLETNLQTNATTMHSFREFSPTLRVSLGKEVATSPDLEQQPVSSRQTNYNIEPHFSPRLTMVVQ